MDIQKKAGFSSDHGRLKTAASDTNIDSQKEQKLMHLIFNVNEAIEREAFCPNPRSAFGCGSCCYSLSCEYGF
jgi:hypothetical protein